MTFLDFYVSSMFAITTVAPIVAFAGVVGSFIPSKPFKGFAIFALVLSIPLLFVSFFGWGFAIIYDRHGLGWTLAAIFTGPIGMIASLVAFIKDLFSRQPLADALLSLAPFVTAALLVWWRLTALKKEH